MGWISSILAIGAKFAAWGFAWWTDRQQQKHDALIKQQTQTEDSLKGDADAIRQVDRVNDAIDRADADGVRRDPLNRNHD